MAHQRSGVWLAQGGDTEHILDFPFVAGKSVGKSAQRSDGQIVGAANNFRFNESPIDMLSRIKDAGEAIDCLPREWADWFSRAKVAPVEIEGFNLSTRSDAV